MAYDARGYWNSLLKNSFDDAGVCWPKWPLEYNKALHRQQLNGFISILSELEVELTNKRVLEVGCGNGFWTSIMSQFNVAEYKGVDIASASIEKLSSKYGSFNFVEADFSEYILNNDELGRFDLALSVLVFLHITDNNKFERCLKTISSALAIGGYFISLDAVSNNELRGSHRQMADGEFFNERYHNKVRYLDRYKQIAHDFGMELVYVAPAFNITQNTFDFKNNLTYSIFNFYFKKILNPILLNSSDKTGLFLGKILPLLDSYFFTNRSFSSKWLVFRKNR